MFAYSAQRTPAIQARNTTTNTTIYIIPEKRGVVNWQHIPVGNDSQ